MDESSIVFSETKNLKNLEIGEIPLTNNQPQRDESIETNLTQRLGKFEEQKNEKPIKISKKECCKKYLQTILYIYCYFCIGFLNSIFGPLVKDLESQVKVDDTTMDWVITSRNLGLLISCPLAGFIFSITKKFDDSKIKWFHLTINKIMIALMVLICLSLVLVPFITNFFLLLLIHFIQGFLFEIVEVGCNVAIAWIWREKVGPYMQALHCFLGVGSVVFPLISTQIFLYVSDRTIHLIVCYSLSGLFIIFSVIPLLIVPCPRSKRVVKKKKRSMSIEFDDEKRKGFLSLVKRKICVSIKNLYSVNSLVYSLSALIKAASTGCYYVYGNLIFMYVKGRSLGSESLLVYITVTFWVTFTIGRFLNIFIVLKVRSFYIVLFNSILLLISYMFVLFFNNVLLIVWIGTAFIGFFVAPLSACAVAFPQSFFDIPVSPVSTSVIYIGSAAGALIVSLLVDLLWIILDTALFLSGIILFTTCLATILITYLVGIKRRKDKKKQERTDFIELVEEEFENEDHFKDDMFGDFFNKKETKEGEMFDDIGEFNTLNPPEENIENVSEGEKNFKIKNEENRETKSEE